MSLDFVAVDFETANSNRASICQFGAVKIVDGRQVNEFNRLVKPHDRLKQFEKARHTELHHITLDDVLEAPEWPEVLGEFESYFVDDLPLVAHRAYTADASMMNRACMLYGIPTLANPWIDTWTLSSVLLPNLPDHTYKTLCRHFGIDMGTHHQGLDDARGAAQILINLAKMVNADDLSELEYAWNDKKHDVSRDFPADLIAYAREHKQDSPSKWLEGMHDSVKPGCICAWCGGMVPQDAPYTVRKCGMCSKECKAAALSQARNLMARFKVFSPIEMHYSI